MTKAEFDSLYSDTITKKEYDAVIGKIGDRFMFIVKKMCPRLKRSDTWFDYGNLDYDNKYGGDGFFDPKYYKDQIEVGGGGGSWSIPGPYGDASPIWFPTRWLWEDDFEKEFHSEVKKYAAEEQARKDKLKQKREDKKIKSAEMKKAISAKLTKEELRFVTFK